MPTFIPAPEPTTGSYTRNQMSVPFLGTYGQLGLTYGQLGYYFYGGQRPPIAERASIVPGTFVPAPDNPVGVFI